MFVVTESLPRLFLFNNKFHSMERSDEHLKRENFHSRTWMERKKIFLSVVVNVACTCALRKKNVYIEMEDKFSFYSFAILYVHFLYRLDWKVIWTTVVVVIKSSDQESNGFYFYFQRKCLLHTHELVSASMYEYNFWGYLIFHDFSRKWWCFRYMFLFYLLRKE